MKVACLCLVAALWGNAFGQVGAVLETSLSRTVMRIGEQTVCTISIRVPAASRVHWPGSAHLAKELEVLQGGSTRIAIAPDSVVYRYSLRITCFSPGVYAIDSLPVAITVGSRKNLLYAPPLTLKVTSPVVTGRPPYDIEPLLATASPWKRAWEVLRWLGITLATAAGLWIGHVGYRRHIVNGSTLLRRTYQSSLKELKKLERQANNPMPLPPAHLYTQVSWILDKYFGQAVGGRFLHQGKVQLSDQLRVHKVPGRLIDELMHLLGELEEARYGDAGEKEGVRQVIATAEGVIRTCQKELLRARSERDSP